MVKRRRNGRPVRPTLVVLSLAVLPILQLQQPALAFSSVILKNKTHTKSRDRRIDKQVLQSSRSTLATTPSTLFETLEQDTDILSKDAVMNRLASSGEFDEVGKHVISLLKQNEYRSAKEILLAMLDFLEEGHPELSDEERMEASQAVDTALQAYYQQAFAPPYRGRKAKYRTGLGTDLMDTQLSCNALASPYEQIPKPILLSALRALTGLKEVKHFDCLENGVSYTDAAYRILQRLITGVGVRDVDTLTSTDDRSTIRLYESDFNRVLNAYSDAGRMEMAHRVVALQERTPQAPTLSPVAFSILLKGYGRLKDLDNVDMLLHHADIGGVEPDLIMLNSLLDAYVNSEAMDTAKSLFSLLRDPTSQLERDNMFRKDYPNLFETSTLPMANKRTYNIYLKGLANQGDLEEALELSDAMRAVGLWDHVTTNTLVQAAVNAYDLETAEELLETYTLPIDTTNGKKTRHPNSEAYTTVMNGFAKYGNIAKAMELMKVMKDRGVEPNEYTFTCLIGALARNQQMEKAKKTLAYMKSSGLQVKVVTYNAIISGMLQRDRSIDEDTYDRHTDEAMLLFKQMVKDGIRPNPVTVSVLLDGFAKCNRPRLAESIALVGKLEGDGIIAPNNMRITTALVQVHGAAGDMEGALAAFRRIKGPDIASINTLLDACVRCDNDHVAMTTFNRYFRGEAELSRLPDVISFSIMIKSALKKLDYEGTAEVRNLYEEMKYRRKILPDRSLVDSILRSIIEYAKGSALQAQDVRFIASVLRDAEKLYWSEGQLEQRKRAVQSIMTGRISGTWEEESGLYGLKSADDYEDELFKKHGWNKVDSGFKLWGARSAAGRSKASGSDDFLLSKGWNNVDSGFRLI